MVEPSASRHPASTDATHIMREFVEHPQGMALFLDLDGTLLDIATKPDCIVVPPGLIDTLRRIESGLGGAMAVLTGRTIFAVDRLLSPLKPIAAGVHGAQLRTSAGGQVGEMVDPLPPSLVEAVQIFAQRLPGVVAESKIHSVALHYRQAPEAEAEIERGLLRLLHEQSDCLMLSRGRRVLEIVTRLASKGTALDALMRLAQFSGRRPVMIGDDANDEPAMQAAMRHGGIGLKVAGEHFAGEAASFSGPADSRRWLTDLARELGQ